MSRGVVESTVAWPTDEELAEVAGSAVVGRGRRYVDRVRSLHVAGNRVTAGVTGSDRYRIELSVSSNGRVEGECTCPHNLDGNFCKHLVAVVIAAREAAAGGAMDPHPEQAKDDPVAAYLQTLDASTLRELLLTAAQSDESLHRSLSIRASVQSGDVSEVAAKLKSMATSALRTGGFVDYRKSFMVARSAGDLLDELERVLDAGGADAARPALLKAVTRLRAITLNGDDSAGVMGGQCQRAADLYARACREGNPDPMALARWLVKFRDDSPGWPDVTLDMFVEALDDKALSAYRRGVVKVAAARQGDRYGRFEVRRMLLELADHDHDLDAAIALLSEEAGHEEFSAIIERCRAVGRDALAARWLDRAIAAGAIEPSDRMRNNFRVPSLDAAQSLHADGRTEDALALLRWLVESHGTPQAYQDLLTFADSLGSREEHRVWARAELAARAERLGRADSLVEVLLDEGDVAGAKSAAERHDCRAAWPRLAEAVAVEDPGWVADKEMPLVLESLLPTHSEGYPRIAQALARVQGLYGRAGRKADFAAAMAQIRADYGRRPALMRAFDRVGL